MNTIRISDETAIRLSQNAMNIQWSDIKTNWLAFEVVPNTMVPKGTHAIIHNNGYKTIIVSSTDLSIQCLINLGLVIPLNAVTNNHQFRTLIKKKGNITAVRDGVFRMALHSPQVDGEIHHIEIAAESHTAILEKIAAYRKYKQQL